MKGPPIYTSSSKPKINPNPENFVSNTASVKDEFRTKILHS